MIFKYYCARIKSGILNRNETEVQSTVSESVSCCHIRLFVTPWTVATRLLCPWDSPGKNTGVGCHSLLQGIFLAQGSNLGFSHFRQILYHLSHQGSPKVQ